MSLADAGSRAQPASHEAGFFAWWSSELARLWPQRGRNLPRGDLILALYDGKKLQVMASGRAGIEELGIVDCPTDERGFDRNADLVAARIRESRLPLVLRLAPGLGLATTDRLPKTAGRELRPIIANRLDGLTPWNAETAAFDTLDVAQAADGMLEVQIAVAPKRSIDRGIELLHQLGLEPDVIDLAIDAEDAVAGEAPTHDLGGAGRRPRLPRSVPIIGGLLVFVAVAAAIFAFFEMQSRQAALAQRQSYALMLTDRLEDLPDLRSRIEALESEDRAALDHHLGRPSALVTIETLSRVLPDTVWLESLRLAEGRLVLNGYSTDTAQLPSLLEGSEAFQAAGFTASSERLMVPKGPDEMIEVDRFSLEADVRPDAGLLP